MSKEQSIVLNIGEEDIPLTEWIMDDLGFFKEMINWTYGDKDYPAWYKNGIRIMLFEDGFWIVAIPEDAFYSMKMYQVEGLAQLYVIHLVLTKERLKIQINEDGTYSHIKE